MRCFRAKAHGRFWDTVPRNEERPTFGESEEKIRMCTAQKNMGSAKFELLAIQCVANYDRKGGWFPNAITRRAIRGGRSTGYAESSHRWVGGGGGGGWGAVVRWANQQRVG